VGLIIDVLF